MDPEALSTLRWNYFQADHFVDLADERLRNAEELLARHPTRNLIETVVQLELEMAARYAAFIDAKDAWRAAMPPGWNLSDDVFVPLRDELDIDRASRSDVS